MSVKKRSVDQPWLVRGKPVDSLDQFPENCYGFVYEITCPNGRKYIGKKALRSYHTSYEKVLNTKTGRMNKVKVVTSTESNWKKYYGSNDEIKAYIKEHGKEGFVREILKLCTSKKNLTYWELAEQCKADVLDVNGKYINDNILGKFFRKDFSE